ncbi:hypothetical protein ACSDR0_04560 [Streptosporangium sp. G11]|uniref:hypothetical protein n=1 Tax=Streptosporangium sp. G11 TaxID=3436926 RepID=UPI003EC1140D
MSNRHIPARWPLLLLALPAGVATWSGWVGLGEKTGFGMVKPLPGISDFEINTAISLPIGVETYAAYALGTWLSSSPVVSATTRRFAKFSSIASLLLGMLGQVAYHLLQVANFTTAPVWIVTVVSCLPVLVLGMGAALGHLLARDGQAYRETEAVTAAAPLENVVPDEELVDEVEGAWRDAKRILRVVDTGQVHRPAVPAQVAEVAPPGDPRGFVSAPGDGPEAEVQPHGVPDPDADLYPLALSHFLADVTQGELPSVRTIKTRMSVGTDRARKLQAYLGQLVEVAS